MPMIHWEQWQQAILVKFHVAGSLSVFFHNWKWSSPVAETDRIVIPDIF